MISALSESVDDRLPADEAVVAFENCEPSSTIRVFLKDGSTVEGAYLFQGRMHFVHVTGGRASLGGTVRGPFASADVLRVETLVTKAEIDARKRYRLLGDPYPGRAPRTREDYEYRLERLAAAIVAEPDRERSDQLRRQFDAVADEIALAKPKRAWLLAAGRWAQRSNARPELRDLWFADVASPCLIARPRPQDFDPDPRMRRRRSPPPADVLADQLSPQNVVKRLEATGLRARIALAGDPVWDRATLIVDLAPGRLHRFMADGRRDGNGVMRWRVVWGGNDNQTAARRCRAIVRTDEYARMQAVFAGEDPPPPGERTARRDTEI